MALVGHFCEENGAMHLTTKLADFLSPHTRPFSNAAQMYEELMDFGTVSQNH